ncbi:MAG: hypothetical protein V4697_00595 [Patescibacteria group bacterium]
MQQQKTYSKKNTFIFIAILLIGAGAFFYFKGSPADTASSLSASGGPESAEVTAVGTRVLSLLNQINSLKIDTSIFNSVVYRSLVDYTITIPEQNVGRPNPFAPIGR